ncbi:MAG TPA: DinB family protein [Vicinamibacterales bacterium]
MHQKQAEHLSRVRHLRESFASENEHLVQLLRQADHAAAERGVEGQWSASQVGWHVASVNTRFAAVIGGDVPAARPLPADFVERPWAEIASAIPDKLEAAAAATPPPKVTCHDAIAALEASAVKMAQAFDTLTADRGSTIGITNPIVGTINLYQVGEWAASHVARHYQQARRALA